MNKNETTAIIRSLLSSCKYAYTISNLNNDFKNETGISIPLFGYANLSDFLHSIPDTVKVTGTYPLEQVTLVTNDKSAHIVSLVKRQRDDGKKKNVFPTPKSRKFEINTGINGFKKYNSSKENAVEKIEKKTDESRKFEVISNNRINGFKKYNSAKENAVEKFEAKADESRKFEVNTRINGFKKYNTPKENAVEKFEEKTDESRKFEVNTRINGFKKYNTPKENAVEKFEEKTDESRKFEVNTRTNGFKKYNTLKENAVEKFVEKADDSHGNNASRACLTDIPLNLSVSSNSFDKFVLVKDCAGIGESIPHIDATLHAQVGAYVEVHPCQIFNPRKFYFRFRKFKKVFSNFMDKLQVFYTNHNIPALRKDVIRPRQICAIRYKLHAEPMWHRVEIQKVVGSVQVVVSFIDDGIKVKIWNKNLKYLHRDFMSLPRQAFLGSLANIRPSGGESNWSLGAIARFCELSLHKDLVAGVVHVDLKDFSMKMALSCTKDLEIHINDTLVNEGFAEYDTSLLDSSFLFYKESKSFKMSTANQNHKSEYLSEKIHHSDQCTEASSKSLEYSFPKKFQNPVFYFSNSYGNNNRLKKMFSVEK